jgi:hypothetical protein
MTPGHVEIQVSLLLCQALEHNLVPIQLLFFVVFMVRRHYSTRFYFDCQSNVVSRNVITSTNTIPDLKCSIGNIS